MSKYDAILRREDGDAIHGEIKPTTIKHKLLYPTVVLSWELGIVAAVNN
jgi:hypothetical protein